eukprot:jgi/Mesen1/1781/ME000014S01183
MECKRPSDFIVQGVQKCPFLRHIMEPTSFRMRADSSVDRSEIQQPATRGPIFEDGPSFDMAFRLFHGRDGVVPLARCEQVSTCRQAESVAHVPVSLAASAATISLSGFGGPTGPFGFEAFKAARDAKINSHNKDERKPADKVSMNHQASSSDWLATGSCPIAKSFRALNGTLPFLAGVLKPPAGMKLECPPAIIAARVALSKTPAMKKLRPQALPVKVLAIGAMGLAFNIPLGVWREHCEKFSPQWIIAVHASVPFIAMLRKAALMPKYAMAFTIASAIIGQTIGSRVERRRVAGLGDVSPLSTGLAVAKRKKRETQEATAESFAPCGIADFRHRTHGVSGPGPVAVA